MVGEPRRQPTCHSGETDGPPSWFDRLAMRVPQGSRLMQRADLTLSLSKAGVRVGVGGGTAASGQARCPWR
jgi:hypothetical protein